MKKKELTKLDIERIQRSREHIKRRKKIYVGQVINCHSYMTTDGSMCAGMCADSLCAFLFKRAAKKQTCPCFVYTNKGLLSITTKALRKAGVEPK